MSRNLKPTVFDPNAKPKLLGKSSCETLNSDEIRTAIGAMVYTFLRVKPGEI
jgi:hypothetical protein